MARQKRKKRLRPLHEPEAPQQFEPGRAQPISCTLIAKQVVAVLLVATCLGSLVAYFIPPPKKFRYPGASLWRQTHAARLWSVARLWGMPRDSKRLVAPSDHMGGEVFLFTRFWGEKLDDRLMPQTKCWDHTRHEHIRYLLPHTGRRIIPPPSGPDKRPPVVVGYLLGPEHLRQDHLWLQTEHTDTVTIEDGHSIGQTFITVFDYDCINLVALFAPLEATLPPAGYSAVVYVNPDRRRVLARTAAVQLLEQEGMRIVALFFNPPARLRYNRGAWPYLVEVSWERPEGYDGPAPVFYSSENDVFVKGEMYADGVARGTHDLAFDIQAMHTDVTGYKAVLALGKPKEGSEWPPYFFAVREDVLDMVGEPRPGEGETEFLERLNKVLLEL